MVGGIYFALLVVGSARQEHWLALALAGLALAVLLYGVLAAPLRHLRTEQLRAHVLGEVDESATRTQRAAAAFVLQREYKANEDPRVRHGLRLRLACALAGTALFVAVTVLLTR